MFAGMPGYPVRVPGIPPLDVQTTRRIAGLLLILGTLFLLDIVTTRIILRMGGIELNPFMAEIVANPILHLVIKAAIFFLIFFVSIIAEQRVKGSSMFFYGVLILMYIAVVLNNLVFIFPRFAL
jgi:hypothetical protein